MRIAQLAPLVESVPPSGYGGTELVVSLLAEQLVQQGHNVTLFASGDSETQAKLVSVVPKSLRELADNLRYRWPAYDLTSLLKLSEMRDEFDVVHNHMGYQALPFLRTLGCPVITTNHNLVSDYCAKIYLEYKDLPYVAISESYRLINYSNQLNYVATIYNGIDLDTYCNVGSNKRDYLLFIGRICYDKGTSAAIDIAKRIGLPLKIAGKIDITDHDYFSTKIRPKLSEANVEFLGEVNEAEKVDLYQHAIATVYPINFEEPFGLVMAESLASGTPILGLDRGSVREVVSDGETGIVGNSVNELIDRFDEIQRISTDACVKRVHQLFSKERMAQQYEDLYIDRMNAFWNTAKAQYEKRT